MFDSANAVPASTVTRTIATPADTVALRDKHFVNVILLEIIDAPPSCAALVGSPSTASPRCPERRAAREQLTKCSVREAFVKSFGEYGAPRRDFVFWERHGLLSARGEASTRST